MPIAVGMEGSECGEGVVGLRSASESMVVVVLVDLTGDVGRGSEPDQNPDGPSDAQVESV